jgi:arginine decarboxylase
MWFETKRVVLTAGTGVGGSSLNAFDNALRNAGIADFNLIKVSSIVPPGVPVCRLRVGTQPVRGEGLMVPTIYADMESVEIDAEVAVAVGAGIPTVDDSAAGIVFVSYCAGRRKDAEHAVEEMVREGMEEKRAGLHEIAVASAHAVVERPWTAVVAAALFMDSTIEATVAGEFDRA